jgi:hypothetical protein
MGVKGRPKHRHVQEDSFKVHHRRESQEDMTDVQSLSSLQKSASFEPGLLRLRHWQGPRRYNIEKNVRILTSNDEPGQYDAVDDDMAGTK